MTVVLAVAVLVLIGFGVWVLVDPAGVTVLVGPPAVTVLVGFGVCVVVGPAGVFVLVRVELGVYVFVGVQLGVFVSVGVVVGGTTVLPNACRYG